MFVVAVTLFTRSIARSLFDLNLCNQKPNLPMKHRILVNLLILLLQVIKRLQLNATQPQRRKKNHECVVHCTTFTEEQLEAKT